jgi:hypothetical protein
MMMKKRKTQFIPKQTGFGIVTGTALLLILFAVFSCRSNDSDNKMTAGGTANVSINLQGEAFDDVADLGGQASLTQGVSVSTSWYRERRFRLITILLWCRIITCKQFFR